MNSHTARAPRTLACLLVALSAILPVHAASAQAAPARAIRMQLSVSAFVVESCTVSSLATAAHATSTCDHGAIASIQHETASTAATDTTIPTTEIGTDMVVVTF